MTSYLSALRRTLGQSGDAAGKPCSVDVWDFVAGKTISGMPKATQLALQPDNCSAVFFTPDGRRLIVFSPTKRENGRITEQLVVIRDARTGKEERRFATPAPLGQGVRLSVAIANEMVAMGMEDEHATVSIWNFRDGTNRKFTAKHSRHPNGGFGVSAITFSPDATRLVTAGRGGSEIKIWDTGTLKLLREVPLTGRPWTEALAVSPDGKTLASGGQNIPIRIWDMDSGTEKVLKGAMSGWVTGVRLTPDGKTAVTFSADQTMRIWEVATGRQLRSVSMPGNEQSFPHGEIAPDGRTLVAAGNENMTMSALVAAWPSRSRTSSEMPRSAVTNQEAKPKWIR